MKFRNQEPGELKVPTGFRKGPDRMIRKVFTLIELLITLAVIAILAGLLLPALNSARKKAQTVQCLGNLKQIGVIVLLYTSDSGDWFMMGDGGVNDVWTRMHKLAPYFVKGKSNLQVNPWSSRPGSDKWISPLLQCPGESSMKWNRSYTLNASVGSRHPVPDLPWRYDGYFCTIQRTSKLGNGRIVVFSDNRNEKYPSASSGMDPNGSDCPFAYRHGNPGPFAGQNGRSCNALYIDGSVGNRTFRFTASELKL